MANWYYYNENGEKIGPIRGRDLKQLVQQGTITRETLVEDENGRTALANNVRGLTFSETVQSEAIPYTKSDTFTITHTPVAPTASTVSVPPPTPKQVFCTNCGKPVSEQTVACMSCGANPASHRKFCRQCGTELSPEQVFCTLCGAKIKGRMQNLGNEAKKITQKISDAFANLSNTAQEDITNDFAPETSQYGNGSCGKINKVVIIKNTVQKVDDLFPLFLPFQENPHADSFAKRFSKTLAEHNQQGWNVVSITYAVIPHVTLSMSQAILFTIGWWLLSICTGGLYVIVYVFLRLFSQNKGQYTVLFEKTIGFDDANGNL